MADGLIILGGSYAACEIALSARAQGYAGAIRILTDESEYPYHRPPLSKAFLLGGEEESGLPLKGEKAYADQGIEVLRGRRATAIDARAACVTLQDGARLSYDHLALAVGARARKLQIPGADLAGILYLRSLGDARALKHALGIAKRVVVIGGGFIGLEVASAAAQLGKAVTVLEAQPDLLMRVVAQPVAAFLRAQHEKHGVVIRTNAQVAEIRGEAGRVRGVVLADGTTLDADLVVVGIGSLPNVELAQSAGLQCRDGVVVDRFGQTSDPRIFAAGDCAFYAGPYTREGMRLESVQNATDQGRIVGASIAGVEKAYDAIPWFWSDQYKFKLQITGVSKGHTSFVTRGDAESLAVFYFKDDACIAVDTINRPRDHMASRRLIPGGVTRSQLEAANYDFAALMPARRRPAETPSPTVG